MKRDILLTFVFFLYTLFSLINLTTYYSTYGTELVGIFCIFLLVLVFTLRVNLKSVAKIFLFVSVFVFFSLVQFYLAKYSEIFWLNTFRIVLWGSVAYLVFDYFLVVGKPGLLKSLYFAGGIALTFFYIQWFAYYFFGEKIDYSLLLGGVESRLNFGLAGFRPGGLTSEPAIYSSFIFCISLAVYLINQKHNVFNYLCLISIVLSQSTVALIMLVLYVLILSFSRVRTMLLGICVSLTGYAYFFDQFSRRIELFSSGEDVSNNIKLSLVRDFVEHSELTMFGYGFVGVSKSAPVYYGGIYDLTLWGSNITTFGVIFGVLLNIYMLVALWRSKFNLFEKGLILVASIKMGTPMLIFFPYGLMLLALINNGRKKKWK